MAKEKVEFVMPSSDADRKKIMALINEAVRCKQEVDVQNEDIKTVKEDLKELFSMDGATAGKYINVFYDRAKVEEQVTSLESVLDNADLISKFK